jgi:hypothetical protein
MNAEAERSFVSWMTMWEDRIVHIGDVAGALVGVIADSGNASFFSRAPVEVRDELLRDIAVFRKNGSWILHVLHSDKEIDETGRMKVCIRLLRDAGLVE